jgi:predicted nucleic acid-binding protein
MMYLVDTDWIVAYLKGRPEATQLLSGLAPAGLAISLITYAEIYEGIYFGQREYEAVCYASRRVESTRTADWRPGPADCGDGNPAPSCSGYS